jgi:ATP-binding cassette subfamily B (MDR/TAP) protein 1
MRFYEADSGTILLDGKKIEEYDVKYLRGLFGVVSQEPMLFNGTIEQNIRYNTE